MPIASAATCTVAGEAQKVDRITTQNDHITLPVVSVTNCAVAGEAQKIDRIMERFAERYCKDNPNAFQTSDGAYLLSFALIMLNTDAHNPMADKKLGLEDFISMCQYQVSTSRRRRRVFR